MRKLSEDIKRVLTPGSALCSLIYALIGAAIAVLLLTIGFWKTLFILAFAAVGALVGGIGNKQEAVRDAVNRRFPAKDAPIKETPVKDRNFSKSEIDEITERIESAIRTDKADSAQDTQE
ncbi:MAG: DUF2273 domain-containing protein [Clostridia bacterium]|nr:DUF2273 domain-containing protein [Clostridia bacterium]